MKLSQAIELLEAQIQKAGDTDILIFGPSGEFIEPVVMSWCWLEEGGQGRDAYYFTDQQR